MDFEELLQRITNMERILELDTHPAPESGSEMTREQLIADNRFLRETLRDLQRQLEEANQTNKQNGEQIVKLYQLLDSDKEEKQKLLAIIESLQSQLAENRKMRFGSKSVKGIDKKPENKGKHDDKDDFDGTPGSLSTQGEAPEPSAEIKQSKGHSRKGSTYKTFEADAKIIHKSDRSQLPEGSEIIKVFTQKVFDHISLIVEHEFECITYRTKDGKAETRYFPMAEDKQAHIYNEVVPGTHATAEMLSHLAFDCHQMSTPVNREMLKMIDHRFRTCRQTLINWLWKGGTLLSRLIPALKNRALEEGSVTNCDETWVRVKTAKRYKKHYIWCLVNKAQGVVECEFYLNHIA